MGRQLLERHVILQADPVEVFATSDDVDGRARHGQDLSDIQRIGPIERIGTGQGFHGDTTAHGDLGQRIAAAYRVGIAAIHARDPGRAR